MKCPCCEGKGYMDEEPDDEGIFSLKYGCYYCKDTSKVGMGKFLLWHYWQFRYSFPSYFDK